MNTLRTLIPVLGDQLSFDLPPLKEGDPAKDHILMMEVGAEARSVPHHPQKIALIFSAMRHFAAEARAAGWAVTYIDYAQGRGSGFVEEIRRAAANLQPQRIEMTCASERRVLALQQALQGELPNLSLSPDTRFFASLETFAQWASDGRSSLRMEFFYRLMRRQTGLLMDGEKPVGGAWNFDKENRKKIPASLVPPARLTFEPDAITREVLALVAQEFGGNFGELTDFNWPVTRAQALAALAHFIEHFLPSFGDYQDAMRGQVYAGDATLYHSLIAPALNLGLLLPHEVCAAAEQAYARGHAPLNAVEGFVRQILGWREFVRGFYWFQGADYAAQNYFQADQPLPPAFWGAPTRMACLSETVQATRDLSYAHHIQRLMITGNLALLLDVAPDAVNEWYLSVYADAFEWVQLPNTHGMALFADGGALASKPYAASGAYINRMSDYCRGCDYDPKQSTGEQACPFNALYWAFMVRHEPRLRPNPRMALIYKQLDKMTPEKRTELEAHGRWLRENSGAL